MKILFLCEGDPETHDSWSGVSLSVTTHLRREGHEVFTGDVDLYGLRRLVVAGRTVARPRKRWWVRYHLDTPGFRARSAKAAKIVRSFENEIDVILQVGATFRLPADIDVPLALYCDSNISLSRAGAAGHSEAAMLTDREYEEIRRREAEVYDRADLIFTMSDMLARSFSVDFGIEPHRLMTIHCAPNVPFPDVGSSEPVADHRPTVLFVGRDFERKGGALLMRAFPEVRRRVPDALLQVVGYVPSDPQPDWARFVGFQSRDTEQGRRAMDDFYRKADVFCLPTRFEPFGTSFVEAMGYQLPCVGPTAWAVPEIISHGQTGLLVEPDDPRALADALVELLLDRELAARMGREGRQRALNHFTWGRIAHRMGGALGALLAPSAPTSEIGTEEGGAA